MTDHPRLLIAATFIIMLGLAPTQPNVLAPLARMFDGGPGGEIVQLRGFATLLAVAGTVGLLSGEAGAAWSKWIARGCIAGAVAAAIWSLTAPWAMVTHAKALANGRPFCVAHHDHRRAVRAFADLRGLRFYTTHSGYKLNSRWFFHGVLLVEDEGRVTAWNWSPRAQAFHPLRDIRRAAPVEDACTPRHDFWHGVGIL